MALAIFLPHCSQKYRSFTMSEGRVRLDNLPIRFPNQFPNGPLPWAFQVEDGWENLIVILCERINTILKEAPENAHFEFLQIKEKFRSEEHTSELKPLMSN